MSRSNLDALVALLDDLESMPATLRDFPLPTALAGLLEAHAHVQRLRGLKGDLSGSLGGKIAMAANALGNTIEGQLVLRVRNGENLCADPILLLGDFPDRGREAGSLAYFVSANPRTLPTDHPAYALLYHAGIYGGCDRWPRVLLPEDRAFWRTSEVISVTQREEALRAERVRREDQRREDDARRERERQAADNLMSMTPSQRKIRDLEQRVAELEAKRPAPAAE